MRRRHYKLEVGPIYTSGWDFNDNDKEHTKTTKGSEHFPGAGSFKVEPVILVIIVIFSCVIFLSLFLVIAFLRKRRRTTDYSDSQEPVQVTRHKRHLSREPSVTSLSSMASTSSIGSLSSFDSFNYPTFSRYKKGKMWSGTSMTKFYDEKRAFRVACGEMGQGACGEKLESAQWRTCAFSFFTDCWWPDLLHQQEDQATALFNYTVSLVPASVLCLFHFLF